MTLTEFTDWANQLAAAASRGARTRLPVVLVGPTVQQAEATLAQIAGQILCPSVVMAQDVEIPRVRGGSFLLVGYLDGAVPLPETREALNRCLSVAASLTGQDVSDLIVGVVA